MPKTQCEPDWDGIHDTDVIQIIHEGIRGDQEQQAELESRPGYSAQYDGMYSEIHRPLAGGETEEVWNARYELVGYELTGKHLSA